MLCLISADKSMIPGTLSSFQVHVLSATSGSVLETTVKFWHTKLNKHTNKTIQQTLKPYPQILRLVWRPFTIYETSHRSGLKASSFQILSAWNALTVTPSAPSCQIPPSLPPFPAGITYVQVSLFLCSPGYVFLPLLLYFGIQGNLVKWRQRW